MLLELPAAEHHKCLTQKRTKEEQAGNGRQHVADRRGHCARGTQPARETREAMDSQLNGRAPAATRPPTAHRRRDETPGSDEASARRQKQGNRLQYAAPVATLLGSGLDVPGRSGRATRVVTRAIDSAIARLRDRARSGTPHHPPRHTHCEPSAEQKCER